MQYLLLIWQLDDDGAPEGGTQADYDAWMAYEAALTEAGAYRESGAPQPHPAGTWVTTALSGHPTVRVDEAEVYAQAELVGFYLIECATASEAEGWARRMPSYGDVEVRPLIDYGAQFG
jgi:hypothetical protein